MEKVIADRVVCKIFSKLVYPISSLAQMFFKSGNFEELRRETIDKSSTAVYCRIPCLRMKDL